MQAEVPKAVVEPPPDAHAAPLRVALVVPKLQIPMLCSQMLEGQAAKRRRIANDVAAAAAGEPAPPDVADVD